MEKMIRSVTEENDTVLIVDDVASSLEFRKFEMFRDKEFLKEYFGNAEILKMWAYPYLTEKNLGLILFAENKIANLVNHDLRIDLKFIEDIKFNLKRRAISIRYNIPKIAKGFFGRGGNKGAIEFSTIKFPTWQSELSKLILGNQKEQLQDKLDSILPEYEEVKAKLNDMQSKFLAGEITEEQHDKFAKDLNKKLKDLEKKKLMIENEIGSLRV